MNNLHSPLPPRMSPRDDPCTTITSFKTSLLLFVVSSFAPCSHPCSHIVSHIVSHLVYDPSPPSPSLLTNTPISTFRVTYCDCGLHLRSKKKGSVACEFCLCDCDSCGGGCLNRPYSVNRSAFEETYGSRYDTTGAGGQGAGPAGGNGNMGRAAASGSNAGEAAGASLNLSWQDMRQKLK